MKKENGVVSSRSRDDGERSCSQLQLTSGVLYGGVFWSRRHADQLRARDEYYGPKSVPLQLPSPYDERTHKQGRSRAARRDLPHTSCRRPFLLELPQVGPARATTHETPPVRLFFSENTPSRDRPARSAPSLAVPCDIFVHQINRASLQP